MKMLLAMLLLFFSTAAYAAGVLRDHAGSDDMIVFGDKPCEDAAVLAHIKPDFRALFKQAGVKHQGRLIRTCWALNPDDSDEVVLIDTEGNGAIVPRKAITFDSEV